MDKPKVVAVVGTNASGKSALGVRLAKTFDGEIISADSRQVFRGLDLGSGKITPEEMQGVPHYLIDVREPGEFFSMADFQKLSYEKIDEIHARGHLPMIVGGTGLYVDSVLDGYLLSDKRTGSGLPRGAGKADHTHALRKACFACAGCAGGTQ